MFVLGHLGIGAQPLEPFIRKGERRWVYLGALLPDLIDKPLYYALAAATGRSGDALGLISGTRTLGHTAVFLLVVLLAGLALRRRAVVLCACGMATHLALDLLTDLEPGHAAAARHGPSTLAAVLFPLLGPHFPAAHFATPRQHVSAIGGVLILGGEAVGAALLLGQYLRVRREARAARPNGLPASR